MASFNVLTEPWIPARGKDGAVKEYGILELLRRARELNEIVDPAPPIQFGLYRVLVAFLMDALQIRETGYLAELLQQDGFDMAVIERYVAAVGVSPFDLFDSDAPFLQTPAPDAERWSVAFLLHHMPFGSFAIHFHHRWEKDQAFSPAVCARALTAIAPFMTAGGRGYSPSINGIPPWYVLVRGADLFETLLLNCYAGETPALSGDEGPAWRANKPVVAKQDARCDSLVEGLTWRPRQVRLIPGDGGICTYTGKQSPVLVREMHWGPGLAFVGQDAWTDPNVAYLYSAQGRSKLRPQEDRELWRDTGPLLLLRKAEHGVGGNKVAFDRPWVVDQLRQLREDYDLFPDRQIDWVEVYGLRTDGHLKVFEWHCERLDLPVGVIRNPKAPGQVRTAIEVAESVAWCLRECLTMAYPRDGEGNKKAFGRIIQEAQRQYWADLRLPFRMQFLESLAVQDPNDQNACRQSAAQWAERLRAVARQRFEEALDPLDADADSLERQARAKAEFRKKLAWTLLPPEARAERKKRERRATNRGG